MASWEGWRTTSAATRLPEARPLPTAAATAAAGSRWGRVDRTLKGNLIPNSGEILSFLVARVELVQGDPSGQRLHSVDFDLVVPMSALFCLGSFKSGNIDMPCRQHGGAPKSKSTKYIC